MLSEAVDEGTLSAPAGSGLGAEKKRVALPKISGYDHPGLSMDTVMRV